MQMPKVTLRKLPETRNAVTGGIRARYNLIDAALEGNVARICRI